MTPGEIAARAEQVAEQLLARGTHLCFEFGGVSTAYHSDEARSGEWIGRFFEGYLLRSSAADADATICSTADPALFAALHDLIPGGAEGGKYDYVDVPFTDAVALTWKEAAKVRPREDVFLLLFRKERRIVLVTSGNAEVRREEGMQLLRAVSKWQLLEQGWVPMHSACAAKNGHVICITGPKAAGKTSTLLNLLARNGCDLVAVDKFLLRDGGARLEICGIPGKVGIRVGTALTQPRVLTWLADEPAPFFPHISPDEVRHIGATNTPAQLRTRSEKIHMTPAELAALVGGSITRTAPLGLILIPVFDLAAEEARLVRAEPEQALELLTTSYVNLHSKGEGFLRHLFELSDAVLRQRLADVLGTYLPEVATYEVHQNHRTNEQTAELIAGLLAEDPTVSDRGR